jgi:nitrogen-specific signal transduction histidine kinase
MTAERRVAIPLDAFPDPAIAYTVEDRDARITAANEAFERRFDDIAAETSVSALFERFHTIDTTGTESPLSHLVRGDRVGLYLDGRGDRGPFFARVIPSDGDTDYLVFSDPGQYPDIEHLPAVDHVSSVISHDLRNPLDVAKAHLHAARETGDPEHFESVADAHDRMERIIRDVLTITRGDSVVDPSEDVPIEPAVTDAWQSVDTERATLDLSKPLPTTTADPDRLRRLFENLFRNSVEHGSTGSRSKTDDSVEHGSTGSRSKTDDSVEHGSTDDPGVTITVGALADGFYVADDGPGIPPEERDAVFEPGYSTRDGGTGLGLAIVERIVAAHGWEMTLTTSDRGGVRFEIRF